MWKENLLEGNWAGNPSPEADGSRRSYSLTSSKSNSELLRDQPGIPVTPRTRSALPALLLRWIRERVRLGRAPRAKAPGQGILVVRAWWGQRGVELGAREKLGAIEARATSISRQLQNGRPNRGVSTEFTKVPLRGSVLHICWIKECMILFPVLLTADGLKTEAMLLSKKEKEKAED